MASPDDKRPTDAELAILRVLWRRGPSTVREVHEELSEQRPSGYTTVLKLLQIMTEKGHVLRDESRRPQVFRPRFHKGRVQGQFVRDLADRLFSGSPGNLVLHALSMEETSLEELEQIRALLSALEARRDNESANDGGESQEGSE